MKISEKAIDKINTGTRCISRLAYIMNRHSTTIERWLKDNEPNGLLTTETCLKVIEQETGLSRNEILTETEQLDGITTIN